MRRTHLGIAALWAAMVSFVLLAAPVSAQDENSDETLGANAEDADALADPNADSAESEEIAGGAEAEDVSTDAASTDEESTPATWSVGADLTQSLGLGTFVSNSYARNSYYAYSLGVTPGYRFNDGTSLSARFSFSQELTDDDSANTAHQVWPSDIWLSANRRLVTIPGEIPMSARLRAILPTSRTARVQGLIMGVEARLGFSRSFGDFNLRVNSAFRKNMHQYETPTIDTSGRQFPLPVRAGDAADLGDGLVSTGSMNESFRVTSSIGLNWQATESLGIDVSYALINGFSYSTPDDAFTAANAQPGHGRRDTAVATIDVSYQLNNMFGLSLGVSTVARPRTADNQNFRFPFFDFNNEADNLTTFYLSFTTTLDANTTRRGD